MSASEAGKFFGKIRWRHFAVGFVILTLAGLSFAGRSYLAIMKRGVPVSFTDFALSYLVDFYLWGAVSPLIFYFSHRYPVERERLFSRIALFLLLGVGLTFAVLALSTPVYWFLDTINVAQFPSFGAFLLANVASPVLFQENYFIYLLAVFVAHAFEYYNQTREGRLQTAALSAQLARAELSALKMQLHPHFLFNTLNSIASLIHRDPETGHRMIVRLSDFLRMTLKNSETHVVALDREFEFLNTYLEIEKIRFQNRLVVETEIDAATENAQVPNLILQPLVENAVRHGLARVTGVGRLRISAKRLNGRVKIEVEDNGPGFSSGNANKRRDGGGVGLANTTARLAQFFGGDYNFEIKEKTDAPGTIVALDFPFVAMRDF